MDVVLKSERYKVLKKLNSKSEKLNFIEEKIFKEFYLYFFTILLFVFGFELFIIFITGYFILPAIILPAIILLILGFTSLYFFPVKNKMNTVMKLKKKNSEKIDLYLKFDYSFDDNIDLYFNQLIELNELGLLSEIDNDVVREIIEKKKKNEKLPNSTNESLLNSFVHFELKKEINTEIVND